MCDTYARHSCAALGGYVCNYYPSREKQIDVTALNSHNQNVLSARSI
jgi:hypothetical protein